MIYIFPVIAFLIYAILGLLFERLWAAISDNTWDDMVSLFIISIWPLLFPIFVIWLLLKVMRGK